MTHPQVGCQIRKSSETTIFLREHEETKSMESKTKAVGLPTRDEECSRAREEESSRPQCNICCF